jgi:DNA-binding protein HU-beta
MNNAELADRIATSHEMSKAEARRLVDAVLAAIVDAAKGGDEVALSGFGRFKVTERAARQGRNPQTGESIEIAASRKLGFAPAKPGARRAEPAGSREEGPGQVGCQGQEGLTASDPPRRTGS